MGGKDYNQKMIDNDRRIAGAERQAQGQWAQNVFDRLVGSIVDVSTLGRCMVLAVDTERRIVAVQPVGGDQLYEAPFRAVTLVAPQGRAG